MPSLLEHKSSIPHALFQALQKANILSVEDLVFHPISHIINQIIKSQENNEINNNAMEIDDQLTTNEMNQSTKSEINVKLFKKQLNILQEYFLSKYSPKAISLDVWLLSDSKNQIGPLVTGSGKLDDLLNGGIHLNEITEIVGNQSSGKTYLCKTIALNTIIEKNSNSVLWITPNSSFQVKEFCKIYDAKKNYWLENMEENSQQQSGDNGNQQQQSLCTLVETLSKIRVIDVNTASELKSLFIELINIIERGEDLFYNTLKLIVIDSLTVLLSQIYHPVINSKLAEREDISFDEIIRLMKRISRKYGISILITNLTSDTINQQDDSRTPLGESCKLFSNTRILLKKLEKQPLNEIGTVFEAKLLKSSRRSLIHPKVYFQIMSLGVVDVNPMSIPIN
ncbi:hypothetical protein ABK040_006060 [Willaertia magna]